MTKSIVITYQEADESFLMMVSKKLGFPISPFKNTEELVSQPEAVVEKENMGDLIKKHNQEFQEMGITLPRKKIDLTKLRGSLNLNMTIDEIDALIKSWRDEWNRDFC